ncbi:MAG TPA: BON domain-containing protein [Terriglobia bacterium]|nr:BON domain-containing protein [Terriglobia bacterium]
MRNTAREGGWWLLFIAGIVAFLPAGLYAGAKKKPLQPQPRKPGAYLKAEVAHQLRMLPYYTVFDNLEYKIDGYHVELDGQVTKPSLKSSAENVVKNIEGVTGVTNNIKVLPPSPADDHIRLAEYRAIYGQASLNKYAIQAVPPIHIIVDNGHVTLVGVVDSQADKNLANIQAQGVPGVFSVKNDLRVEK